MNILVIHTWGIGDLLMATPAFCSIKKAHPEYQIDVLVAQPASRLVLINNPNIRNVIVCKHNPISFLFVLFKLYRKYDISLVTSGVNPLKGSLFSFLTGAEMRIGETRIGHTFSFYTKTIPFDPLMHRVESDNKLFSLLNKDEIANNIPMQLFPEEQALQDVEKYLIKNNLHASPIVLIHPGCNAQYKHRRWPKERFKDLLLQLHERYPHHSLLVVLGPDENDDKDFYSTLSFIHLITDWPMSHIIALCSKINVFINTDSGLGHIAACFTAHIYTIFGPANEKETRPYSNHATIIRKSKCPDCISRTKSGCSLKCLNELTVEDVIKVIDLK